MRWEDPFEIFVGVRGTMAILTGELLQWIDVGEELACVALLVFLVACDGLKPFDFLVHHIGPHELGLLHLHLEHVELALLEGQELVDYFTLAKLRVFKDFIYEFLQLNLAT